MSGSIETGNFLSPRIPKGFRRAYDQAADAAVDAKIDDGLIRERARRMAEDDRYRKHQDTYWEAAKISLLMELQIKADVWREVLILFSRSIDSGEFDINR